MRTRTARHYVLIAAVLLTSIFTALVASAATPANAEAAQACPMIYPRPAYCDGGGVQLAGPNYTGWVYMNLNHCPNGVVCRLMYRESAAAWRWTGSRWVGAQIRGGWVYVSPYTGNWRWAWTQRSGWVAIKGERFERR